MSKSDYGSSQQIVNGLVQWGEAKSTIDGQETHPFPSDYQCVASSIAVVTNRKSPGSKSILPAKCSDPAYFTTERNNDVDGTQPFYWLSIGNLASAPQGSSVVNDSSGKPVATIKWGTFNSVHDYEEHFDFPERFKTDCYSVIVCRQKANAKDVLPVTRADKNGFYVDRNDGIDGTQPFFWIAIGDCAANSNKCFSFQMGDYIVKGGSGTSTKGATQSFAFSQFGLTSFPSACEAVVVNRKNRNSRNILPVTYADRSAFNIDRNNDIDGSQLFYWIAVGK